MMLAVPEALAGGAFFMYLFPKIMHGWDAPPMDFSVAVWVGFIACFGMATETGIIMLVYLREAIEKRGGLENIKSLEELRQAVIEGAVHRLRPKLLTEGVAIIAIFPMVFATRRRRRNPGPDGAARARRPADLRRSRGPVPAGALLLGAAGAVVEDTGRRRRRGNGKQISSEQRLKPGLQRRKSLLPNFGLLSHNTGRRRRMLVQAGQVGPQNARKVAP